VEDEKTIEPFYIKDCALIAIATGKRAQNLRELREHLLQIEPGSIYYHFWGGLLRPRFDDTEYHNDFAIWVARGLHNKSLAERLGVIDPVAFGTIEEVRNELVEIIDESLDETEFPQWTKRDDQFEFIRSQIVVFDTAISVSRPEDLLDIIGNISVGSIFYHFIDARHRNENSLDDFQNWLSDCGEDYAPICRKIREKSSYFSPLRELKSDLEEVFFEHFRNGQKRNG
jgi:hypothetical protein